MSNDPTLKDFFHDMNRHGNADYERVPPNLVIETEVRITDVRVVVWEAVKRHSQYVRPDDGNRYVWDAIGSERFDRREEATSDTVVLTTSNQVHEWCDEHPYEGPREPHDVDS